MTIAPSAKWRSVRNPRTRARIVTSSRARVVPLGVTSIGTLIRRDSTTPTVGAGGAALAAVFWQPDRANKARASHAAPATRRATRMGTRSKGLITRILPKIRAAPVPPRDTCPSDKRSRRAGQPQCNPPITGLGWAVALRPTLTLGLQGRP